MAGFAACRALSTDFNDTPETASRPYDKRPRRFRHGRGRRHAWCSRNTSTPRRAAPRSMPRSIGYGLSGDAYHITAPRRDGDGAYPLHEGGAEARRADARRHRLHQRPRHLDHGRRRSNSARSSACSAMRRRRVSMSSTKSAIGHLLGAAGAVEAIFSHPRHSRQRRAADAQSRQSRRSRRRSTWCRTSRAEARRSTWRCRTPSASAAPTPRWFSSATVADRPRRLGQRLLWPCRQFCHIRSATLPKCIRRGMKSAVRNETNPVGNGEFGRPPGDTRRRSFPNPPMRPCGRKRVHRPPSRSRVRAASWSCPWILS